MFVVWCLAEALSGSALRASSGALGGKLLEGSVILEIPPQTKSIPQSVLDTAKQKGVIIRDTNGKVY